MSGSASLSTLNLPSLTSVTNYLEFDSNTALTTVNLPVLTSAPNGIHLSNSFISFSTSGPAELNIGGTLLTDVNIGSITSLEHVDANVFSTGSGLTTLDLGSLTTVNDYVDLGGSKLNYL